MRSDYHDRVITAVLVSIAILSIIALLVDGIPAIPYIGFAIFTAWIYNRVINNANTSKNLEKDRVSWFITLLSSINPKIQYNIDAYSLFSSKKMKTDDALKAELGIHQFRVPKERVLPDISAAEVELDKLEERASIILGAIVFLPVVFGLMHLFRTVGLGIFLLELISVILLGFIVLQSQGNRYSLEDWKAIYDFLESNQTELTNNPRQFMTKQQWATQLYLSQELGMFPEKVSELPAITFLHMVIKLMNELDPAQRERYLLKILENIDDLPTKEDLMSKRWDAYKMRVILISLSATALGGLFASLTVYSIPLLSTPGFNLGGTTYLSWGQYILLITLNTYVLLQWYSVKDTLKWLIIITAFYITFYLVNRIII